MTADIAVLILLILAGACFAAATFGWSPVRPALVPLGLLLATWAGIVTVWP